MRQGTVDTVHTCPAPSFRHLHGAQEPAGEDGLDFLVRLELAEARDRAAGGTHKGSPKQSQRPSPKQQQQGEMLEPQQPLAAGAATAQQQQQQGSGGGAVSRGVTFHSQLIMSIGSIVEGYDRSVQPCLAFGGDSPYTDQEDKFYGTKMFVKTFRQHAALEDESARRMFNVAAAEEAALRAQQLREWLAADNTPRGRATTSLENKHYAQHLALMQRANVRYQMLKDRKQLRGGAAVFKEGGGLLESQSVLRRPPTVAEEGHEPNFMLRQAEEVGRDQRATMRAATTVAQLQVSPTRDRKAERRRTASVRG